MINCPDGILLVDKEAGPTSAKVIATIKRKLLIGGKIGHAGTLDPFATGLLIVLIGKATRLADYFQSSNKVYSGEISFGTKTDTDDITGSVIEKKPFSADLSQLELAAQAMTGKIRQIPPAVSAIHSGGKRAYQLVREGFIPELAAREVFLKSVILSNFTECSVRFSIECSKGFYVRAFARDLGIAVGSCACLRTLRREASLPFQVSQALRIDQLSIESIVPWDKAFMLRGNSEIWLEDNEFAQLRNGLVPFSLNKKTPTKLDECGDGLLVYRRQSDGLAGGLLSKKDQGLSIELNI